MTGQSAKIIALEDRDTCTDLAVAGERLTCDWAGCLFWPDEETLIVSDLHLEKGASFARRGSLIPPYDTATTLHRLAQRIAVWQPKRVISLGDSFHDETAADNLPADYATILLSLMKDRDWIWISGNHDPQPPARLGGKSAREIWIRNLVFRHEPLSGNQGGEIAGHLHPTGKIFRRNRSVRRPCFVSDGERMIMPSFGAYTGGLNIRHQAFSGLFSEDKLSAVLLGNGRVFHIAGRNLVP